MSVEASLEFLQWVILLCLALGLAASLRALKLLDGKIDRGYVAPTRLMPGDRLATPDSLWDAREQAVERAVLFGSADCRSCVRLAESLVRRSANRADLAVALLWQTHSPDKFSSAYSFAEQDALFRTLHIGALPYLAIIDRDGVVRAAGSIGSEASLNDKLGSSAVSRQTAERS